MTRSWLLVAGLVVAVVVVAGLLLRPASLPDQVSACDRHFRISAGSAVTDRRTADTHRPGRAPFQPVGADGSLEILGHPQELACGVVVLVGPDDEHLTAYALQGGP